MASASHSLNATISWGGAVGSIYKWARKGQKWKSCDTTVLSEAAMTFLPGRQDAGEMSFGIRWIKTDFGTIHAAAVARTTQTATLTFPEGSTWACSAFCTDLGDDVPEDDVIVTDVTLKFTGAPTFTAAA